MTSPDSLAHNEPWASVGNISGQNYWQSLVSCLWLRRCSGRGWARHANCRLQPRPKPHAAVMYATGVTLGTHPLDWCIVRYAPFGQVYCEVRTLWKGVLWGTHRLDGCIVRYAPFGRVYCEVRTVWTGVLCGTHRMGGCTMSYAPYGRVYYEVRILWAGISWGTHRMGGCTMRLITVWAVVLYKWQLAIVRYVPYDEGPKRYSVILSIKQCHV